MPAQQRGRLDEQPAPDRGWQQPREPGQHRSVGPVEPRPGHLPPQHRDLMAQQQELSIRGC
jgi:hypothetical protein